MALTRPDIPWDSTKAGQWNDGLMLAEILSSVDGKPQKVYFCRSRGMEPMPLIVSLHTWGGSYKQIDPLADLAASANWNYIHPDFRGENSNPEACLSPFVISDIDDAIEYAGTQLNVDRKNIFVVGVSGGGYAACGMLLNTKHSVKRILAWASITDLVEWHKETSATPGSEKYAKNILACVGDIDAQLNIEEAQRRSPMFMPITLPLRSGIDLYAGIDDGWTGSVSVSHSIRFFNRLADHLSAPTVVVSNRDLIGLKNRTYQADSDQGLLGSRKIILRREMPDATLAIFQGGHEMLPAVAFQRLQALVR